jgi:D-alanine-D-alanine ligase
MPVKVLVLSGSDSPEREVSLRSGAAVASGLRQAGYEVSIADPIAGLENLLPDLKAAGIVFPVLHGIGGEDGELQLFLERNDIKFIGSGSTASSLCFYKAGYAELLEKNSILTPKTKLVNLDEYGNDPLAKQPFVLKPNGGGSSIDTFIVRDISQKDDTAIKDAFGRHGQLLLQELITGVEITVGVLGEESLPVIEIVPPADQEFDYDNKYNGDTQELCPPEHVSEADQTSARKLAEQIHELCGCRDLSRTDIMISEKGGLYTLETNTIPGLTDQSLLPKAAAADGIDMPMLCGRLVEATLSRR